MTAEETYLRDQLERYATDFATLVNSYGEMARKLDTVERSLQLSNAGRELFNGFVASARHALCVVTDPRGRVRDVFTPALSRGWLGMEPSPGVILADFLGPDFSFVLNDVARRRRRGEAGGAEFCCASPGQAGAMRVFRFEPQGCDRSLIWLIRPPESFLIREHGSPQGLFGSALPLQTDLCDAEGCVVASTGRRPFCGELQVGSRHPVLHPLFGDAEGQRDLSAGIRSVLEAGRAWEGVVPGTDTAQVGGTWVRMLPVPMSLHDDTPGILVQHFDMSSLEGLGQNLFELAHRDEITGLLNQRMFRHEIDDLIRLSPSTGGGFSLLGVELAHYSQMRSALGSVAGDAILARFAGELGSLVRDEDALGRIGDSRFAILLRGPEDGQSTYLRIMERFTALDSRPLLVEGKPYYLDVHAVVVRYPEDASGVEGLLSQAERQLSVRHGRISEQLFYPAARRVIVALREALCTAQGFNLLYQPQVDLQRGTIVGVEALVRLSGRKGLGIGPDHFIPVAEHYGLIESVDLWVAGAAAGQLACWRREGYRVRMAINLSARVFCNPVHLNAVMRVIREAGVDLRDIELEVTETAAMSRDCDVYGTSSQLRDEGVAVAIDDFGTGHSNLERLREMRVSRIKIDQSFVAGLGKNERDAQLVGAVIAMAHSLGVLAVAEGVESRAQMDVLRRLGCDEVQGFLYARPASAAHVGQLLTQSCIAPGPDSNSVTSEVAR